MGVDCDRDRADVRATAQSGCECNRLTDPQKGEQRAQACANACLRQLTPFTSGVCPLLRPEITCECARFEAAIS